MNIFTGPVSGALLVLAQLQQKKLQDVFYLSCAPKVGTLATRKNISFTLNLHKIEYTTLGFRQLDVIKNLCYTLLLKSR